MPRPRPHLHPEDGPRGAAASRLSIFDISLPSIVTAAPPHLSSEGGRGLASNIYTHLSPGVSLIYDLAHDGGMLQSELFTSKNQNLVLAKLPN